MRGSRRDGLTLLEVVGAIVILGTVLVGVVLARSRHTRQLARSEQVSAAVRRADELIASWWAGPEGIPVGRTGRIEAQTSLAWRTRRVPNDAIERLGGRVVRIEIRDTEADEADPNGREPLVVVEVVLPDPDAEEAGQP